MERFPQSRSILARAALSLMAVSASVTVSGEVYQWRDENGKVHFSDKKPKQQKAKDISESVESVNVDQSQAERDKLGRIFKPETAEEKALKQRKAAQEHNDKVRNAQRCAKAKKGLEILRGPVYFTRDDGSTYDISLEEQARRVAKLERDIRKNCP
ncbi:MAG: DUF4124 domain-containing protein [Cellvibrionaceae bacterium]